MDWVRGRSLGSGSFATVHLAIPSNGSSAPFAVKSSDDFTSYLLKNEEHILNRIGSSCPQIIKCFGHDSTFENGESFYNLFLEYASGGTLSDQLKNHQGRKFHESQVKRYTRSIIEGLKHVHENGFVHCDVKLQNILVFEDGNVKLADFGLAKEKGKKPGNKLECRGTPLFMSPESVNDSEYESPADIWALGCAVVEMVTGKPAWDLGKGSNIWALLIRIGVGEELPIIPEEMSEQGKDFLRKCFVKDPLKRWTAEMLLNHPFVSCDDDIVSVSRVPSPSPSPRTNFDFPYWGSCSSIETASASTVSSCLPNLYSPADRLRRLTAEQWRPDWSETEVWTSVR